MNITQESSRGGSEHAGDDVEMLDGSDRSRPSPPLELLVRRMLILILLYVMPVALATNLPVIDNDIWWHLRSGEWILEHRAVPTTDPFSIGGQDKPWMDYQWLFQLLVHLLYSEFGLIGVAAYRVALVLAIAVAMHRLVAKREPRFVPAVMLVALGLIASAPLLQKERPWLVTISFCTLTLDAVLDLRAGVRSRLPWLLPLCYAFWANVHIQFVYGLLILGLACVAPLLDRLRGVHRGSGHADTFRSRSWWGLAVLTGLCTAATLLTPYHVSIYRDVMTYASQAGLLDAIAELQAMSFRTLSDWTTLGLTCAAAFALGRRKAPSAFEFLLLAAAAYFSFRTYRDVWFVTLAALAILSTSGLGSASADDRFPLTRRRTAALATAVAIAVAIAGWNRGFDERSLRHRVSAEYPDEAAAVLERRGDRGPLFNSFNWGGYLIWRLPGVPVSIDGRTNVHSEARILTSANTWSGRGWDADPELAAAGVVLASVKDPLFSLLRLDPRFELVHQDKTAALFITHFDPPVPARR